MSKIRTFAEAEAAGDLPPKMLPKKPYVVPLFQKLTPKPSSKIYRSGKTRKDKGK